jgi:hypothetical protein
MLRFRFSRDATGSQPTSYILFLFQKLKEIHTWCKTKVIDLIEMHPGVVQTKDAHRMQIRQNFQSNNIEEADV